jgi:RimJ/RimL family protein N-acetyltransferase
MPKFAELKTERKELILVPLDKKHKQFYIELLNDKKIQKTLFRAFRTVTEDAFDKTYEKMYADKVKEIVYVMEIKKFLKRHPIGYMKINLIDWTNKSCYISVAISADENTRGKGYAKAAYNSFFNFLFTLGFHKVYGRTYEENIPTIKLNRATGFRFIGRQKHFVLYEKNVSQDALFFERLSDKLDHSFQNKHMVLLLPVYQKIKEYLSDGKSLPTLEKPKNLKAELKKWYDNKGSYIPQFEYNTDEISIFVARTKALEDFLATFLAENQHKLPFDWQQHLKRFIENARLRRELAESIGTKQYQTANMAFYFAEIPKESIQQVKNIVSQKQKQPKATFSGGKKKLPAEQICETVVHSIFGNEVRIVGSPKMAPGGLNFTSRELSISTLIPWTTKKLQKFIVHESTHLITHLNAYRANLPLLSIGFTPGYLWFNEGIATYIADTLCTNDEFPKRAIVNWRLKAIFESSSPKTLYKNIMSDELFSKLDPEECFTFIYRFWRGIDGDSLQFSYKRLTYLPGFLFVKELAQKQSLNSFLYGTLAYNDHEYLFSQFFGRNLTYDLNTLFAVKTKAIEAIKKAVHNK